MNNDVTCNLVLLLCVFPFKEPLHLTLNKHYFNIHLILETFLSISVESYACLRQISHFSVFRWTIVLLQKKAVVYAKNNLNGSALIKQSQSSL